MVREVRNLRDALETTSEISRLLKYSPKRDRMFEKLKAELAPETPGFSCPLSNKVDSKGVITAKRD